MSHELIKRGEFRIQDARVDPIFDCGMSIVEERICEALFELRVEQVALRILENMYVVAARMNNGRSITLTFESKHVPDLLNDSHYQMIARGMIDHYNEHIIK